MFQGSGPLVFVVLVCTIMILSGILGGILAGLKNRDYSYWIAWSFVLPPALIVLAFLPTRKGPRPRRPTIAEEDERIED